MDSIRGYLDTKKATMAEYARLTGVEDKWLSWDDMMRYFLENNQLCMDFEIEPGNSKEYADGVNCAVYDMKKALDRVKILKSL